MFLSDRENIVSAQSPRDGAGRLTPEMSSFRLLVLRFVEDYITQHRGSPSYGEISAGLGDASRTRVKRAVKALVAEGVLVQGGGPRSLSMPTLRDEAVRQLRDLGWKVDEDLKEIRPPGGTNRTLLPPPALTYPSRRGTGIEKCGSEESARRGGSEAA